jgi:hypothetical protein
MRPWCRGIRGQASPCRAEAASRRVARAVLVDCKLAVLAQLTRPWRFAEQFSRPVQLAKCLVCESLQGHHGQHCRCQRRRATITPNIVVAGNAFTRAGPAGQSPRRGARRPPGRRSRLPAGCVIVCYLLSLSTPEAAQRQVVWVSYSCQRARPRSRSNRNNHGILHLSHLR